MILLLPLFAVFLTVTPSLCLPTNFTTFLLVTSPSPIPSSNTSSLHAISATSLIDPFNQPALLLRLTGPGYNSLPNFTLADGTLSTYATAPFGGGLKKYNSTIVTAGAELQFLASSQPAGNLGLDTDYLLTVDGESKGWTICDGALQNEVLSWKGEANATKTGCRETYVHAVTKAPY
ncbi:hypothetical protein ACN47E_005373 [Coniothyrium glycines]